MDKIVVTNRRAKHDYEILETWEAGLELKGSEVKSIREGKVSLNDSFGRIENGQVLLYNMHISTYAEASFFNVEPKRVRRLLLHKNQIRKITDSVTQRGFTLIPLRLYFSQRGFAKIEIALCKGRKLYDRREAIKRREAELEMRRILKSRRK